MPHRQDNDARLDKTIQVRLGRHLRALYRGFVGEPIPQDQIELVLALRRADRERR